MPCSCEGWPPTPSYASLIDSAEDAMRQIKALQSALEENKEMRKHLEDELLTLKKAFEIMGAGG